jgi:hypothetical protein
LYEFDAIEGLFLGGLVEFDREVDFLDGEFDVVRSESAFGGGMHAFFHDDLDDVCEYVGLLGLSLLIADLQFSPFQDDFDDFLLGLVGEELVEVCLFGHHPV